MKHHKSRKFICLLALVPLFLAACQPAALEVTNLLAKPTAMAAQPLEAAGEAPASVPLKTPGAMETAVPVQPVETVTQAAPTAEDSAPEGWQVLNDSTRGYALAYPAEWQYSDDTPYSRIFSEIQKVPAGLGPPLRLYVSAFPKDYTNTDWQVYNFITNETIRGFLSLPVGESMLREPKAMAPDYFTYTRLPNRMVAEQDALVIENAKVWEAPSGTKDRVVLFSTGGTAYIIGMYYETPAQLAMFEQILDSFQILPSLPAIN